MYVCILGITLHLGGRLWQQFVVDAFAAVEQYRLDWIRNNQTVIRSDLYKSIRDSIRKDDTNPEQLGQKSYTSGYLYGISAIHESIF